MDGDAGIKLALAYVTSRDLLSKLLGPTADYLGSELQLWTQRRIENIGMIFRNAEQKLGDEILEDGSVPPKVPSEFKKDMYLKRCEQTNQVHCFVDELSEFVRPNDSPGVIRHFILATSHFRFRLFSKEPHLEHQRPNQHHLE